MKRLLVFITIVVYSIATIYDIISVASWIMKFNLNSNIIIVVGLGVCVIYLLWDLAGRITNKL